MASWAREKAATLRLHVLNMRMPFLDFRGAAEPQSAEKFKSRMTLLTSPTKYDDAWDVPKEDYALYEQTHPFWLTWREKARLTGSTIAEAVLFHVHETAKKLDLPPSMYDKEPVSEYWRMHQMRMVYGKMPRTPFGMPGAIFAAWGKRKENTAMYNFLEVFPDWHYHERGLIVITDAQLKSRRLTDHLSGKPIESFPVELGDSPDGLLERVDTDTGESEWAALELKAPTQFLPEGDKDYTPGAGFQMKQFRYTYPYPHVKAYYLPQCMFHMLALGVDKCFFVSWTYPGGMSVWEIKFSRVYVSLLLTIMRFIYEEYSSQNKLVPNDLFTIHPDPKVRQTHALLVDMTKKICESLKPVPVPDSQAEKFPDYLKKRPAPEPGAVPLPGSQSLLAVGPQIPPAKKPRVERPTPTVDGWVTMTITDKLTTHTGSGYTKLRDMPEEYVPFIKMFLFGVAVFGEGLGMEWTSKYEDVAIREANIRAISRSRLFDFCDDLVTESLRGEMYRPEIRGLYVTKSAILESIEKVFAENLRSIFLAMTDASGLKRAPKMEDTVMEDYQREVAGIAAVYEANGDNDMHDAAVGLVGSIGTEGEWLDRLSSFTKAVAVAWSDKKKTTVDKDKLTHDIFSLQGLVSRIRTPESTERKWVAQVMRATLILRILARNVVAPE